MCIIFNINYIIRILGNLYILNLIIVLLFRFIQLYYILIHFLKHIIHINVIYLDFEVNNQNLLLIHLLLFFFLFLKFYKYKLLNRQL